MLSCLSFIHIKSTIKNEGSHSSLYLFLSIYTSVNVYPWYDYVEYIVAERNECFMGVFLSEEWITIDRTPGLLSPEKRKKQISLNNVPLPMHTKVGVCI